tara:strand:+ start:651 stop:1451 length:801 start_codon:yes stop_codon:yes gene_type:complete
MSSGARDTDPFTLVPNWVLREGMLDPNELAVYLVLLSHRDYTTGRAYPGLGMIAKEARMSRRTVIRTVPKLEAQGLLKVTRRKGDSGKNEVNNYTVALFARARPADETEAKRSPSERLASGRGSASANVTPPSDTESLPPSDRLALKEEPLLTRTKEVADSVTLPRDGAISFDVVSISATEKQLGLLNDLHILSGSGIPEEELKKDWAHLNQAAAAERIGAYYKYMPRASDYQGPWDGEDDYNALSPQGQDWADASFNVGEQQRVS